MRYSKQREKIYEAVKSTKCHPDADWVYEKVRQEITDISLGTVYRDLKALAKAGMLDSLETTHDTLRFDADLSVHAHFVCNGCGTIFDMPIKAKAQVPKGFICAKEKHVYYGTCANCASGLKQTK